MNRLHIRLGPTLGMRLQGFAVSRFGPDRLRSRLLTATGWSDASTRSRWRANSAWCFFHQAGRPWKRPSECWVALSKGISCLYLQPCCVKAQTPSCTHLSQ